MNLIPSDPRARADALIALAGWLSEMAERDADAFEVPDLIRAHVIAVDVGRDNPFFATALAALNDAALDLIAVNERRERAVRHGRSNWAEYALEQRRVVQRQIILSLAAFVMTSSALKPSGFDASLSIRQQAAGEAADAVEAIQARHSERKAGACT